MDNDQHYKLIDDDNCFEYIHSKPEVTMAHKVNRQTIENYKVILECKKIDSCTFVLTAQDIGAMKEQNITQGHYYLLKVICVRDSKVFYPRMLKMASSIVNIDWFGQALAESEGFTFDSPICLHNCKELVFSVTEPITNIYIETMFECRSQILRKMSHQSTYILLCDEVCETLVYKTQDITACLSEIRFHGEYISAITIIYKGIMLLDNAPACLLEKSNGVIAYKLANNINILGALKINKNLVLEIIVKTNKKENILVFGKKNLVIDKKID